MPDPVEEALHTVEIYCKRRVPPDLREEIRIECSRRGKSITISERRPPWEPEYGPEWSTSKVAQLRYEDTAGTWSLHCPDSNGRWWPYDGVEPSATVVPLLTEIDDDPTGIFWG